MFLEVAAAVELAAHLSAIPDEVMRSTMLAMTKSHKLLPVILYGMSRGSQVPLLQNLHQNQ
jgi:hypothetical protein